jgi:signal transduction histidine kinase
VTEAPTGKVVYINRIARQLPGVGARDAIADPASLQTPERTLRVVRFHAQGRELLLLSLQEIRPELEAREQQAWHALLRVLTHEIMNSLTPITSLAATARGMTEPSTDLGRSLEIIHKRSAGLLQFVQSYRDLTREIRPHFAPLDLRSAVADAVHFLDLPSSITIEYTFPDFLPEAHADSQLLAQALINVLKNAAEALPAQIGTLRIGITLSLSHLHLSIADTGCGIEAAHLSQVFIPFFTTKPGGNGIGLSLSRQLLRAMRGDLALASAPGEGTTVTLSLERVG